MHPILLRTLFCVLVLGLAACGTSGPAATRDYSTFNDLADILRQQPGLQVTGSGSNVKVSIRGQNSINLDTRPMYVINDVPVGTDYSQANNAVNVRDVDRVEVLRGLSSTNSYGGQGANGVIKIYTKTHKN